MPHMRCRRGFLPLFLESDADAGRVLLHGREQFGALEGHTLQGRAGDVGR